jgi:hypothetical protein
VDQRRRHRKARIVVSARHADRSRVPYEDLACRRVDGGATGSQEYRGMGSSLHGFIATSMSCHRGILGLGHIIVEGLFCAAVWEPAKHLVPHLSILSDSEVLTGTLKSSVDPEKVLSYPLPQDECMQRPGVLDAYFNINSYWFPSPSPSGRYSPKMALLTLPRSAISMLHAAERDFPCSMYYMLIHSESTVFSNRGISIMGETHSAVSMDPP